MFHVVSRDLENIEEPSPPAYHMSLHADYSLMMETDSKPQVFVTSESKRFFPGSVRWRFIVIFVATLGILSLTLIILQFVVPRNTNTKTTKLPDVACSGDCTITLVESIPENLAFPKGSIRNPSIYSGWMNLLKMATKEIDIASFYWTLRGDDTSTSDPSTKQGEDVFQNLEAAAERGGPQKIA